MDKNQATGLILFAAVILVYSLFFANNPEPVREDQAVTQTEVQDLDSPAVNADEPLKPDTVSNALRQQKYGEFSNLTQGTEETITLENAQVRAVLGSDGSLVNLFD